jgi:MFS family permease
MGRAGEPITAGLVVVGLALLVLFVAIERRVLHPMIDLTLFRVRLFWACNASLLLNALARGSTGFVMSWYFQAVLHDSPLIAGLKLIPMVSTMVLLAPVAGRLSDRFGSRWLATLGLTFTLLAQLWMITFPVDVPYPTLGIALAVLGVGNGLFNSPNTSALMGSVPSNRRGVAAGMRTLLNNTGQTTAVAAAMVVLSTVMSYQVLSALFGSGGGETALEAQLFMRGFHEVFLVSAAISAVAIVLSSLRGAEGATAPAARPAPAA